MFTITAGVVFLVVMIWALWPRQYEVALRDVSYQTARQLGAEVGKRVLLARCKFLWAARRKAVYALLKHPGTSIEVRGNGRLETFIHRCNG